MSLDFCADQYVLSLMPAPIDLRLSLDATRDFSYWRTRAVSYSSLPARLESIYRFKPDIVIRSYGGGVAIRSRLEALGIPVVQLNTVSHLSMVSDNVRLVAKHIDRQTEAEAMIKAWEQEMAQLNGASLSKSLLYVTASGTVAGQKTLINELIRRAGFSNYNQGHYWSTLPLESIAMKPPELFATAFFNPKQYIHQWSPVKHDVARQAMSQQPTLALNSAEIACPGLYTINAIRQMRNAY